MKKICVYTTNRAEYSKLRPILKLLQEDSEIDLSLLVTGSHLLKEYGHSIDQIKKDNILVTEEIFTHIAGDDPSKTVETIGVALLKLPSILKKINPDIILCGFDRFDMFPFAISASLMNYCLVHIEGGEITGTLDEKIRHAISKLSNYHLVSTEDAKINLVKMGEFEDKIFVTGCPRYDELLLIDKKDNTESSLNICKKYNITPNNFFIVCYHPVSTNIEQSAKLWEFLLSSIKDLSEDIIFIKPNIDYGNEKLLNIYKESKIENKKNVYLHKHIDIDDFSMLMKYSKCLIGNSSAGVREACVFGTPVINLGTRQNYRIRKEMENVHTMTDFNKEELDNKIKELSIIRYNRNLVYGDGNSSKKIVNILKNINTKDNSKVISYCDNNNTTKKIVNIIKQINTKDSSKNVSYTDT